MRSNLLSSAMLCTLTLILSACLLTLPAVSNADPSPNAAMRHANYIFNSVHHAMRQWGSSLDHNGMSIFLATVPADTEFYHGSSSAWPINGTQWLAFEPEHALNFANCHRPGKGGPPPPGGRPPHGEHFSSGHIEAPPYGLWDRSHGAERKAQNLPRLRNVQALLVGSASDLRSDETSTELEKAVSNAHKPNERENETCAGFPHTYRTMRELRLLYVDGQSAAKSDKGTLDIQNLILRVPNSDHHDPDHELGRGPGGPPGDSRRALKLFNSVEHE
jgi:hypothetical protein